jgi:hypothetical protein
MARGRHRIAIGLSLGLLFGPAPALAVGDPPPPAASDWLPHIQRTIAAQEYQASRNERGLQAPNRRHGLRTYFEPGGIRVHDRTAPGSPALLSLRLAGLGRGAALAPVAAGEIRGEGARVEIRRPGLVEWYLNSEAGLEQGFTLSERPDGEGALVLELALSGAHARLAGDRVLIATDAGRKLAYGALAGWDAGRVPVPTRFELASTDRLRIVVDDAGAAYPLTIDPLLTETADTQIESDEGSAELGFSVAGAGDVNGDGLADVIVGAPNYDAGQSDEGAAFVFHGNANGIATGSAASANARLESNQSDSRMGQSVASAGDVNGDGYADVIVGAYLYDAGENDEGAAFVFLGGPSGVANGDPSTAGAQLESNQADAYLGFGLASGDVNGDGYADVIVSAYNYDAGELNEGAAFVFLGSSTGIADGSPTTAASQLESDQAGAQLGRGVSSAGDVNGDGYADVIAGAPFYDAGQSHEGAAFVFHGGPSGIPSGDPTTAATQLESNQADAIFGISVASGGDVNGDGYADVIVGAADYDSGQTDEGAAFVFLGSASGVASANPATASAQLESDQGTAQFGISVAGAGDVNGDGYADVIVGAPTYDAPSGDEGAAFLFLGSSSGIASGNPAVADAQLESDQAQAALGYSVASAGDVNGDGFADVIVGAYLYDGGQTNEGAAFVYHGGAHGIRSGNPSTAGAQLESDQASAHLGQSVGAAGDVNGDGFADVIVGAHQFTAGHSTEGAAFLALGSASGIASADPSTLATQLEADQNAAGMGYSVAGAGDVNGDGYADVIVGAPFFDAGQSEEGAAFVFHGGAAGIADGGPGSAATQLEADQANAALGRSVAGAGDVNGDGYADVIVGADLYTAGETNEGVAFVFLGSASGITSGGAAAAAAQLESDQPDSYFGQSVASAGDVNGDGFADVIVGAPRYDAGEADEGAAFVFHGSATGIADGDPGTADAQIESDQASAWLGTSVAAAGDVNGDGYADVIVGAHAYAGVGWAFLFQGGSAGVGDGDPGTADTSLSGSGTNDEFGSSVAGAGDVNGDGFADVIVGAPRDDAGQGEYEGAAYVFLGSAGGIATAGAGSAAAQLESNQAGARFGNSVAGAGDVNGDGFADALVGSYVYDQGESDEGAAFVFYGGGNQTGRPVLARQLRGGSATPVQPWGSGEHGDAFQVSLRATHPAGRGRVKLEVEACPAGVDFFGGGCVRRISTSWTDVTATSGGVTLTETVSGLAGAELYHWRARVLHAPFGVTQSGIAAAAYPPHGPWRRYSGQSLEADLRTLTDTDDDGIADATDTDDDGDGLLDVHETDTGTYVSPTDTGTDPLDPDSDDDGLLDGAEVALGTDPNDSDHDDDGDLDGADNCPFIVNAAQTNSDALAAGDACQCGDVTNDGIVNAADVARASESLVGATLGGSFVAERCNVVGPNDAGPTVCDVGDLSLIDRFAQGQSVTVENACDAYFEP